MTRLALVVLAAAAVVTFAQEDAALPKPAARIAGGGNPNSFAIGGTRRLVASSHSHYVGEISPYLKKQMEQEAERKRNQPRTVLSVFTRSASIKSPWYVPRARKTAEQRMSELSAASIPIHVRKPTFRTAHFF
ncbi:hypothetical protein PRIPAC_89379 [Pristionchus pacificus]|uniref:Uncharacterized protein n=1 Tax=Pristionchus pacificus TaxID=54126 RepID=A0A2A6B7U1_PRIPA|nr:hypothetical protein PRIPAC_89379 [Pristionchus pacificus]|eukprot:PDM61931.1 hypothetical protein PRIPAC_51373 [Pristionchus pacificus]